MSKNIKLNIDYSILKNWAKYAFSPLYSENFSNIDTKVRDDIKNYLKTTPLDEVSAERVMFDFYQFFNDFLARNDKQYLREEDITVFIMNLIVWLSNKYIFDKKDLIDIAISKKWIDKSNLLYIALHNIFDFPQLSFVKIERLLDGDDPFNPYSLDVDVCHVAQKRGWGSGYSSLYPFSDVCNDMANLSRLKIHELVLDLHTFFDDFALKRLPNGVEKLIINVDPSFTKSTENDERQLSYLFCNRMASFPATLMEVDLSSLTNMTYINFEAFYYQSNLPKIILPKSANGNKLYVTADIDLKQKFVFLADHYEILNA